jgi:hypothetical protein
MIRVSAIAPIAILAAVSCGPTLCASSVFAAEATEFTVHQEIPDLTDVDVGKEGKSHGDMLAFEATISTTDGEKGILSGILITVDLPDDQGDVFEDRIGNLVFRFGDSDSIVVAGASVYAQDTTEMNANHPQVRAVIGGTGKYLGARGQVTTTRNEDGTYDHAFKMID